MPGRIPSTGTEDTRNAVTVKVGSIDSITQAGLYHTLTPAGAGGPPPAVSDFQILPLIKPGDPLADGTNVDILALIGPAPGADLVLQPGDWQVWGYLTDGRQVIIRPLDVLTIY